MQTAGPVHYEQALQQIISEAYSGLQGAVWMPVWPDSSARCDGT